MRPTQCPSSPNPAFSPRPYLPIFLFSSPSHRVFPFPSLLHVFACSINDNFTLLSPLRPLPINGFPSSLFLISSPTSLFSDSRGTCGRVFLIIFYRLLILPSRWPYIKRHASHSLSIPASRLYNLGHSVSTKGEYVRCIFSRFLLLLYASPSLRFLFSSVLNASSFFLDSLFIASFY